MFVGLGVLLQEGSCLGGVACQLVTCTSGSGLSSKPAASPTSARPGRPIPRPYSPRLMHRAVEAWMKSKPGEGWAEPLRSEFLEAPRAIDQLSFADASP